ncbi:hypothetical protein R1flu_007184 [Riccia fluitans]|uniref:Alpha-taxilin n=1 Tax=Riccia fluitans TaxID=41844 RepID=A0ABD1YY48_9MARC
MCLAPPHVGSRGALVYGRKAPHQPGLFKQTKLESGQVFEACFDLRQRTLQPRERIFLFHPIVVSADRLFTRGAIGACGGRKSRSQREKNLSWKFYSGFLTGLFENEKLGNFPRRLPSVCMEPPSSSSPGLVAASGSMELHARLLFDKEVLGDGRGEASAAAPIKSKLPKGESLDEGFLECEIEAAELVEAEVAGDGSSMGFCDNGGIVIKPADVEAVASGLVECSATSSLSSAASSSHSIECMLPVEDASIGLSEVPCDIKDTMASHRVDLPDVDNHSTDATSLPMKTVLFPADMDDYTEVRAESTELDVQSSDRITGEKFRKFPVPLSHGDYPDYNACNNVIARSNSDENVGRNDYSAPNGVSSSKGSGSDSEGDECKRPSSSNATHISSSRDKNLPDEPLHGILESKIAELENACTGTFKAEDDDSKSVKVKKRQLKEMRVLLEGNDRSSEEKLRQLNTKYVQQVAETRKLEKDFVMLNRKYKQANKEKDTMYAELTKSTALRQKLESLCRELQRQNKMLLDDNKRVASEEEQKRLELSGKFQNTVKDITSRLEKQGDERLKQLEENEILREKLKHFTQQYDIREQHFAHQLRTKSLEYQLLEVKLKQQEDLYSQSESKSRMYSEQIAQLLKTEQELRAQLALYGDKFEQFQETLTKSNEVFATFKSEMEKMSKTVKKLEKENLALKKKCEKSDVSIIDLLGERDVLRKQLQTAKTQKEKLEGLCRSLQQERKQQLLTVDSTSSSRPPLPDNVEQGNAE